MSARIEYFGRLQVHQPVKETIYCPVQTRAARMWSDPEPAEYCENEVSDHGDLCDQHEAMDACEDYDA